MNSFSSGAKVFIQGMESIISDMYLFKYDRQV